MATFISYIQYVLPTTALVPQTRSAIGSFANVHYREPQRSVPQPYTACIHEGHKNRLPVTKESQIRVDIHYTARHYTIRPNIISWSPHAQIHIRPSPIANYKDSVAGIERREYFDYLLTDDICECMLFLSCRVVFAYNVNRPLMYEQLTIMHRVILNIQNCSIHRIDN
jgi:hypothetical protein